MGNNILSSKKKESELKVLTETEKLVKETISILNDENKFPKRQRAMFGARFADNAIGSYENLRAANRLFPESKNIVKERYELALEAEKTMSALVSDINLLPTITSTCDNTTLWYNNYQKDALHCESAMKKWRISETKRFKDDMNKLSTKKDGKDDKAKNNIINIKNAESSNKKEFIII